MSGKLMGQVYELELGHSHQSIALALADHGHDDGTHIYPGIEYLAWKTGYSERNVIRLLQDLEEKKLLVPVNGQSIGRGNVQEYFMDISAVPKKAPFEKGKHVKTSVFRKHDNLSKGDKSDTEKVTSQTLKGDKSDTEDSTYARAFEPSVNRHNEPSVSTANAVAATAAPPQTSAPSSSPSKQKAERPPKPDSIPKTHPVRIAIAQACGIDTDSPLTEQKTFILLANTTRAFLAASLTPEDVGRAEQYWYSHDGRGRRGELPSLSTLRECAMKMNKPQTQTLGANSNGTHQGQYRQYEPAVDRRHRHTVGGALSLAEWESDLSRREREHEQGRGLDFFELAARRA